MGEECCTHDMRNAHNILVGIPEGKKPFVRQMRKGVIILEWILEK